MFRFDELKHVHIEISTRCQASCPMCARNNRGGLENPFLPIKDMDLKTFQYIFNETVLSQISTICMCGNFGDPIMNDDLIGMCRYVKDKAPKVQITIHTNGGARKTDWWRELKNNLPENHSVLFAIDGLEDTHHIYRIGTTYDKVITNAKTFIAEGGIAEWVFIKFKHNEHQEEEVKRRSQALGFKRFTMKNTNRFVGEDKFSVLDKNGNHRYYLEPPSDNKVSVINLDSIKKFKIEYKQVDIDCYSKKHKEIYIDVHGHVSPCCFISHAKYSMPANRPLIADIKQQIKDQYNNLIEDLGGQDSCDLTKRSIFDFMESDEWHEVWSKYWGTEKLITCAKTCGDLNISKPKEQIVENKIFNKYK